MTILLQLKPQHYDPDRQLHSKEEPHLELPVVVHQSVYSSFQKRPYPVEYDHQSIGWREAKHVNQEILSEFPILLVIEGITGIGSQHHQEEHQDHEHLEESRGQVEVVGSQAISESQESENFHVALDQ